MSVSDELQERVEELQNQPSPGVEERAESEEGEILESGRTVGDLIELLAELRDVTVSVWENDELERLPNGLKKNLNNQLERVLEASQHFANQQNQAQDLEKRVDQLHGFLWQNNLIDRPEELPGFELKNKQLESLRSKGREIVKELDSGLKQRDALNALHEEVHELKADVLKKAESIDAYHADTSEWASKAEKSLQAIEQHESAAKNSEESVEGALNRAEESANDVDALKKKVETFVGEIQEAREKMNEIQSDARSTVETNDERTTEIIERNEELEQQVKDQLERATAGSLFKEFNHRKDELRKTKRAWGAVSIVALAASIPWGVWIAGSAGNLDTAFFVKLAATLPLFAIIVFSLRQYGRERRAEEEYAFKSALSLSLTPYKDLIEDLETSEQDAEYVNFLVKTIGQIYESPKLPSRSESADDDIISLKAANRLSDMFARFLDR